MDENWIFFEFDTFIWFTKKLGLSARKTFVHSWNFFPFFLQLRKKSRITRTHNFADFQLKKLIFTVQRNVTYKRSWVMRLIQNLSPKKNCSTQTRGKTENCSNEFSHFLVLRKKSLSIEIYETFRIFFFGGKLFQFSDYFCPSYFTKKFPVIYLFIYSYFFCCVLNLNLN